MPAANTDKLKKYKSLFSTTLNTGIGTGTSDTITPATVTGLPTDTAITLTFDRVNSAGTATPGFLERITGVVSGGNFTSYVRNRDSTTEQAHSSTAVIEMIWNAQDWNDMVDWGLVEHNQDGTHEALFLVSGYIAASAVTASKIAASAVLAGNLSASAVRSGNINASAVLATNLAASSVVAGNLAASSVLSGNLAASSIVLGNLSASSVSSGNLNFSPSGVVTSVKRQNITTDSDQTGVTMVNGWTFETGNGSTAFLPTGGTAKTITFPVTFSTPPVVLVSFAGYRDGSDPTLISDLSGAGVFTIHVGAEQISTTAFKLFMQTVDAGNINNGRRVGVTWIAIGTV